MRLEALLEVEHPVIQAPMAGAQGSALAIAVAEAGGLGSLPCALLDEAAIRREVGAIRARTSKPVNLNFFCHRQPRRDEHRERQWRERLAPYFEELGLDPASVQASAGRESFTAELADLVEDLRPEIVSFHFGLPPAALLDRVRGIGTTVLSSATTVDEAKWLEARGVDAIIAQGLEAGGHRGMFLTEDLEAQTGTFALLPLIVRAVSVPVIAAGGITDAASVAAALKLGAAGVQAGTVYLLSDEATTTPVHRAVLASDAARFTAITTLFTGRPARGIVNRLIRELGPRPTGVPEFPLASAALVPLRAKAEAGGSGDFSPLWAGQNTSACRAVSAGGITSALASGVK